MLAKGWLLGLQFEPLFTNHLYKTIGPPAIESANTIKRPLLNNGYRLLFDTPTDQILVILPDKNMTPLAEKVSFGLWERFDESHTVIRLASSWSITKEEPNCLCRVFKTLATND